MKHLLMIVILMLLVLVSSSYADFRVGIKGGVHMGNASITEPDEDTKMRLGMVHGPYVEIIPMGGGLFAFRIEALWVDKGWSQETTILTRTYNTDFSIKELALDPLLLLYFGNPQFGTAPFLQFGPDLGFSMSTLSRTDTDPAALAEFQDWAGLNFGLNIGGGVSFRAGMGKVVADLRYNLGLTDMNTSDSNNAPKIVTNGIQLQVGYDFSVFSRFRKI